MNSNHQSIYSSAHIYILTILLGGCLQLSGCGSNHPDQEAKPNFVIVLADDQGWGDLSHSGNTMISTPNIDKLAENGVSLENMYVCPVCSPTRAEFLTGRYYPRSGVYSTSEGGERIDLDETTFAELFKEAGYKTAAYGKWHNGMQYPYHPNARGFDDYYGFCAGHWGDYFSPMLERNGKIVRGEGFIIDDLTNKGIDFIKQNKDQPFLLYLPFNTPHGPMQAPMEYWDKFKDMPLTMDHPYREEEDKDFTRAAYAMCENIDWNVGRLVKALQELQIEDNTIFIYFTDNGPNGWRWNGGMKGRKGHTDEGGVKTPFFIQWKKHIAAGSTIKPIASAIDMFPTLLDMAGIAYSTEKTLDGRSLRPLIMQEGKTWPDRLIINYWADRVSVRSQEFRLDDKNKLFNMMKDFGQTMDVSDQYPEIFAQLKSAKEKFQKEVLSELPEKDMRTFPVGHPDFIYTQLPARDGKGHGNIQRSNRWPNCSYYTNWLHTDDKITWEVEVLADGEFEVEVYYTCKKDDVGTEIQLAFNDQQINGIINEAHDPPLVGMEHDLVVRHNSYVKDFKPFKLGRIHLSKGVGTMTLTAPKIPGDQSIDFRLMLLTRVD